MMITKRISIASLDVDPETGKIWLNSPNCILRIQNLNFKHIEDKFAMIDINGNEVFMIPGDFGFSSYSDFLEKISILLYSKLYDLPELEGSKFLDEVYNIIQVHIKNLKNTSKE